MVPHRVTRSAPLSTMRTVIDVIYIGNSVAGHLFGGQAQGWRIHSAPYSTAKLTSILTQNSRIRQNKYQSLSITGRCRLLFRYTGIRMPKRVLYATRTSALASVVAVSGIIHARHDFPSSECVFHIGIRLRHTRSILRENEGAGHSADGRYTGKMPSAP